MYTVYVLYGYFYFVWFVDIYTVYNVVGTPGFVTVIRTKSVFVFCVKKRTKSLP